jgi:hypothetical protein
MEEVLLKERSDFLLQDEKVSGGGFKSDRNSLQEYMLEAIETCSKRRWIWRKKLKPRGKVLLIGAPRRSESFGDSPRPRNNQEINQVC